MITATFDMGLHKKRRSTLQARIKNRADFVAARDRALDELRLAESLVKKYERATGYADDFHRAFAAAARALNEIDNSIPQELRNSCRDESLRAEFEEILSIRQQLIREKSQTLQAVKHSAGQRKERRDSQYRYIQTIGHRLCCRTAHPKSGIGTGAGTNSNGSQIRRSDGSCLQ